ncbi:AB-hydrolase YheT [Trametes punicea]|nr:AB-hydrolase YheT [Trametes punicea]
MTDSVQAALFVAFLAIGCGAMYKMWQCREGRRSPFVTLYTSSQSALLPRDAQRKAEPVLSLAQLIHDKVPSLAPTATFDGVWWLPGGDAQTVYSSIADFSQVDPVVYERRYLQLPDQGIVAIDISPPLASHPISRAEEVLFVAHGLTGGSHESYVRAVLARVTPSKNAGGLGLRAVVFNFRGCNGSPVVTPRLYHAGSSDDIRHVILWICHTFPECRIYGLGFSLGGNILTKYAGEEGEKCPLQALVTLANPWDFVTGHYHLRSTFLGRNIYRYVLGKAMQRLVQLHRKALLDAPKLPISRQSLERFLSKPKITLAQFDESFTAPMYGFRNAIDYYMRISSSQLGQDIRIPCLAINSWDDPIVGTESLPIRKIPSECPWVVLAVTRSGGHLGWYERGPDGRISRWYVKPVEQFLAALMEYGLEPRQKYRSVVSGAEFVRDPERDDVGFRELTQEQSELVVSGVEESKLFTGW